MTFLTPRPMLHCRKRFFSLVEVTVVIAIMAVLCSIAAVKIREGSPGSKFEKAVQSFREFLLRCRNTAREDGKNIGIYFVPEENKCIAISLADESLHRSDDTYWINSPAPPRYILEDFSGDTLRAKYGVDAAGEEQPTHTWMLPDDCVLAVNTVPEVDGNQDNDNGWKLFFSCYAAGSVTGDGITLSCSGFSAVITCTPLTGTVEIKEGGDQ